MRPKAFSRFNGTVTSSAVAAESLRRPLWVISGRKAAPISMSAFGGKADVNHQTPECPLLAISGHSATRVISPNSSKIGCTEIPLASVQISLGILWISGQHQRGTGIGLIPYIWRRRCVRLRVSPRAEKRGGVPVIGTLQVARTCINPDLPWAIPRWGPLPGADERPQGTQVKA